MQVKDITVRLGVIEGVWEVVGADRRRGVVPESVALTADKWGPRLATFDLRRDPGSPVPDLKPFTPVEVDVGGIRRWSGRVKETPTRDGDDAVVNVRCEGWQYHLDDDGFDRSYIHTKLDGFKDMRSTPGALLGAGALFAAGQFSQDQGLYLAHPNATTVVAGCAVSCILDLGPDNTFKRIVVDWDASNNASSYDMRAYASDQPTNAYPTGSFELLFSIANNSGTSGQTSATATTARRYLHLFLLNTIFNGTTAADIWWRIKKCQVFAETAYESGAASILKASTIVTDALSRGTLLLNADRSQVQASSFSIPDFDPDQYRSTREVWEAANAFENFTSKIDEYAIPIFRSKSTTPAVEVGHWRGSLFEDASANSTEEIYSRVIVQGQSFDGQPVAVTRTAGQLAGAAGSTPAVVVANPSADTNTTGVTATLGTLSRDTTIFDSSPASFKITNTGQAQTQHDMTGTFARGVTYTLGLAQRVVAGNTASIVVLKFGDPATGDQAGRVYFVDGSLLAGFVTTTLSWTPTADTTNGKLQTLIWDPYGGTVTLNVDTLSLAQSGATAVDRGGFRRTKVLPVKAALTDVVAARIGDLWLPDHTSTPLKGTVTVVGDGAARDVLTGVDVPPEAFLQKTDEMLRLSHRTDPDTGGHARDSRIAEVTWTAKDDTAVISLDNTRQNFEALLERLAVVTGQG